MVQTSVLFREDKQSGPVFLFVYTQGHTACSVYPLGSCASSRHRNRSKLPVYQISVGSASYVINQICTREHSLLYWFKKIYFIYFLVYFLMWHYIFSVMSMVDWYRFGSEISSGDFRVGRCTKWGGRITGQLTTPGNRWTISSPVSTLWKTSSRRGRKIRKGEQRKEGKRRWEMYRYIAESLKME